MFQRCAPPIFELMGYLPLGAIWAKWDFAQKLTSFILIFNDGFEFLMV